MNTFARSTLGNKVNWDLDLESATLTMHTEVTDLGRSETELKVQNATGSTDLKDAYSLQFLMDMANHMTGDTVHFETNAPLASAVFTDKKDSHFVHLIMPVQRDD
jgi:DNA polymerase III sliding clamp (beta) subunit (PCNA family)